MNEGMNEPTNEQLNLFPQLSRTLRLRLSLGLEDRNHGGNTVEFLGGQCRSEWPTTGVLGPEEGSNNQEETAKRHPFHESS